MSEKRISERSLKNVRDSAYLSILLMESSKKHLSSSTTGMILLSVLFRIQDRNMNRLQQEVEWFTKKFDYRNNDKPWGTSKDALNPWNQKSYRQQRF